jgi:hypothetical protein
MRVAITSTQRELYDVPWYFTSTYKVPGKMAQDDFANLINLNINW